MEGEGLLFGRLDPNNRGSKAEWDGGQLEGLKLCTWVL